MEDKAQATIYSYMINQNILTGILGVNPNLLAKEMGVKDSPFDTYTDTTWSLFTRIKRDLAKEIHHTSQSNGINYDAVLEIAKDMGERHSRIALEYDLALNLAFHTNEAEKTLIWVRTKHGSELITK